MTENRRYIRRKAWLRKPYVWVLGILLLLALGSDFLANGLPLYARKDGETRYPVLEKKGADWGLRSERSDLNFPEQWQGENVTDAVWCPIRYSSRQTDRYNDRFRKPHALRDDTPQNAPHYLGTDELGHDVAAILIHGAGISFFIGVFSMLLATFIGLAIGAAAGFWGDDRLRLNRGLWLWLALGACCMYFYGIHTRQNRYAQALTEGGIAFVIQSLLSLAIMAAILLFFGWIGKKLPLFRRGKKYPVPVDFVLGRLIEFMLVLPKIILILAVAATAKPSILLPALMIGFTAWPAVARFTRAEMWHVRHSDYLRSAETFGLGEARLFFRHALPNSLGPVPSLVAFGIAGAILAESTLSFLGIGIPPDVFTWGKLLAQGRSNPSAWWVTLLPGLMIFLTVTCFHKLGEDLQGQTPTKKKFLRYFF